MALPSKSKRGFDEACDRRVGWGNLFILSPSCFSPFSPVLISVLTSCRPKTGTFAPGVRCGFYELWLMTAALASHPSLLTSPIKESKSMSCFQLSNGAFWNMFMGFGPCWVDGRSIACLEWVRKGVLQGSPGENRQLSGCGKRATTCGKDWTNLDKIRLMCPVKNIFRLSHYICFSFH